MPGATISFTSDFNNTINGAPKGAEKSYHGIDPSTKKELWPIPVATEQDLEDAVTAADAAFKTWSRTSLDERKECIKNFADAIEAHKKDFVELLMKEVGKPAFNADAEMTATIGTYRGHLNFNIPTHVSQDDEVAKIITQYAPIGIVGGILPWNFPVVLASNKIVSAVFVGCTIIVKPSPFTPYSILKLVELAQTCFPKGVIQALGGNDNLGPWIVKHPKIPKISFTGSIPTGKKIQEVAAKQLKRVTLELGGNDPSIICPDVNIEETAGKVAAGAFFNTGQICVAIKRIYVHSSIYREFLTAFTSAVTKLEQSKFFGPIQNSMQFDKVSSIYEDCKANKYTFALGDGNITHSNGYFAPATVIDNPPNESRIVKEEPFGPIVPLQPWDDEDEVIARANDTNAGLGASVFSKDLERARKIAARLEAGTVWINSGARFLPTGYFAGQKESGIGGEGGELGLLQYCNAQTVYEFR